MNYYVLRVRRRHSTFAAGFIVSSVIVVLGLAVNAGHGSGHRKTDKDGQHISHSGVANVRKKIPITIILLIDILLRDFCRGEIFGKTKIIPIRIYLQVIITPRGLAHYDGDSKINV